MAHVLVTGSADGPGRATARTLLDDGLDVVVRACDDDRLTAVGDLLDRGAVAVTGDLSDLHQVRDIADRVDRLGRMGADHPGAEVVTVDAGPLGLDGVGDVAGLLPAAGRAAEAVVVATEVDRAPW